MARVLLEETILNTLTDLIFIYLVVFTSVLFVEKVRSDSGNSPFTIPIIICHVQSEVK